MHAPDNRFKNWLIVFVIFKAKIPEIHRFPALEVCIFKYMFLVFHDSKLNTFAYYTLFINVCNKQFHVNFSKLKWGIFSILWLSVNQQGDGCMHADSGGIFLLS